MSRIPVPAGTSGKTMIPGDAYCVRCQADVFPAGERQGEGHIAVRFGHDDARNHVIYEGDTVLTRAYEVMAGPGGWVIEVHPDSWAGGCHDCGGRMPLRRLRYGEFAVRRVAGGLKHGC